jgi:hypothetical protein
MLSTRRNGPRSAPNASHSVHLDDPDTVVAAIRDVLAAAAKGDHLE